MTTLLKSFIVIVLISVLIAWAFALGWTAPLTLEGTLSTSGQLDFVPGLCFTDG